MKIREKGKCPLYYLFIGAIIMACLLGAIVKNYSFYRKEVSEAFWKASLCVFASRTGRGVRLGYETV